MEFSLVGNCRDEAELCEDRAGERTGRCTEVQGRGISNNSQKKENKNNLKNKIRTQ